MVKYIGLCQTPFINYLSSQNILSMCVHWIYCLVPEKTKAQWNYLLKVRTIEKNHLIFAFSEVWGLEYIHGRKGSDGLGRHLSVDLGTVGFAQGLVLLREQRKKLFWDEETMIVYLWVVCVYVCVCVCSLVGVGEVHPLGINLQLSIPFPVLSKVALPNHCPRNS